MEDIKTDVVIVGTGIAGLSAAYHATKTGLKAIIVTKGRIGGGASFFPLKASLGIQTTGGHDDIPVFLKDIMEVADGMNDAELARIYVRESGACINTLNKIGFEPWLRSDKRPACFSPHARNIWLINGWEKARNKAREYIRYNHLFFENTQLLKVITQDNQVQGVFILSEGEIIRIQCSSVILAGGGIAGLYRHNLYPSDITGSLHSVALDAGASLVNMEFIQFIPGITAPKYKVLFGEHTLKYGISLFNENGNDVLDEYNKEEKNAIFQERSGYAPFSCNFKSSIIDIKLHEYSINNSSDLMIKYSPSLYKDEDEFFSVYLNWLEKEAGINLINTPVTLAPFAHSCNGGIKINTDSESSVEGLFAVGEISSAIEGANRMGGNSVGASLVYSERAIMKSLQYKGKNLRKDSSEKESAGLINGKSNLHRSSEFSALREMMTRNAGIVRNKEGLSKTLDYINSLIHPLHNEKNTEYYHSLRTAKSMLLAMLARTESRGAHYRNDYPNRDNHKYRTEISFGKYDKEPVVKKIITEKDFLNEQ
ncbi:FAD-binding protein [Salmonella enterica]|nr:FAD-binding protein [Salmonella enterica]EKC2307892.1 FAD-binding protein [Salmonella enterica]EKC2386625.1 FAD-binding protein [Salmonella enterica]EKC2532699.1 FAD-binding protein [Salmonella enterica]EKC2985277.1 FAD-binding protein [Salmonella enterica]